MTTTPQVGTKVRALTMTATEQSVLVEVTSIESADERGWIVWGYRNNRGARPRQTMYPRRYFVPVSAC